MSQYSLNELINIIKKLPSEQIKDFINLRRLLLISESKEKKKIGPNCLTGGTVWGGYTSASTGFLENRLITLQGGIGDIIHLEPGDLSEIYEIIIEKIKGNQDINFNNIMNMVYEGVTEYFGRGSDPIKRMDFFPDEDMIDEGKERGKLSALKGQNIAMCVERAAASQNVMNFIGVSSYIKMSGVIVDEKPDIHAYNLVENNGLYYIFDSTIPAQKDGHTSPIICEIPMEAYMKMISGSSQSGYAIDTEFYSPPTDKIRTITYDSGF